ncbi:MAG: 2-C-methyl-D-erythritol 4-phosphate cytidylyltransferase [Rickettsiales bacterium]|nr:2-C-methyl-D-erythritol 4-phosphate cytidylyltransferase [Rickettsiales bacterium]|tara:strand:- start:11611 stop:12288 length:678 start_codon:yes stop_codon:yes gene_type:complete
MSKINLIIPAAGTSNRFQSIIPKQFHVLNGKTILEHTLSAFKDIQLEDCLIAVNKNTEEKVHDILEKISFSARTVRGGDTRAESVREAFYEAKESDITLIHDAARMCLTRPLIERVIEAAWRYDAVIPAIPVTDTIKKVQKDRVIKTLTRDDLVAVQTPQAFKTASLRRAYENYYDKSITDEASLIENAGNAVHIIKGESDNIKVTYPLDLEYVRNYIKKNNNNN